MINKVIVYHYHKIEGWWLSSADKYVSAMDNKYSWKVLSPNGEIRPNYIDERGAPPQFKK